LRSAAAIRFVDKPYSHESLEGRIRLLLGLFGKRTG